MPLIEAALAFAITMLALSLVVSSFVELVHRVFAMREDGLKYMLGQMFDQVLGKCVIPKLRTDVETANPGIAEAARDPLVNQLLATARTAFVERMSANRAPMGVTPNATPTVPVRTGPAVRWWSPRLWGGRDLATMTPAEFMERLGSIDIGAQIKTANDTANTAANTANLANAAVITAGTAAADATDAVLKNVAQKFDAFGKEAGAYFEGRARLLSVAVAIGLAFLAHVDAVDLFRTYLRDPNARAKVIEQSQAVTEQYKSAQQAADAVKKLVPDANAAPADVKAEVEKLQKDWQAAIGNTNATVKQYADLGLPLGWNDARIEAADMSLWLWTCKDPKTLKGQGLETLRGQCSPDEKDYAGLKGRQFMDVWVQVPKAPNVWFYLFLGGLLIGLGSPFWYDAVTGLTSLRNAAGGKAGSAAPPPPQQPAAGVAPAPQVVNAQPVTPVGAFKVSYAAR
jgi:hypothetical protein